MPVRTGLVSGRQLDCTRSGLSGVIRVRITCYAFQRTGVSIGIRVRASAMSIMKTPG
jgi:hypothetical protein